MAIISAGTTRTTNGGKAALVATAKDKGLVLRTYDTGESDKRLSLLLYEKGRTFAYARGAGNPKSKFYPSAQMFAFSEFVLYDGGGFLSVTQSDVLNSFYGVRADFERLCFASHVLEMADYMLLPGMPCKDELRLIYSALSRLSSKDYPARLAAVVFELKFLQMEGFAADSLPDANLSDAAAKAVSWVMSSEIKDIFSFNLSENSCVELSRNLDIFRQNVLQGPSKSLELLKSL